MRCFKSLSIIILLSLALLISGCSGTPDNTTTDNTSSDFISDISSIPEIVSSEESSEPSSVPVIASEPEPEPPASSAPPVSSAPPAPAPTPPRDPIAVGSYTVNDPDNGRGLSIVRSGYSFGVGSNGQPPSQSVNNQNLFNSLAGVKALAIDTVSADNVMYLTFDCGYEYNNLTGSILDTLKAKNVKAAFFCTLSYLKQEPEFVNRMINEGHIVGNHSATHPDFTTINRTKMATELYEVDKYLGEKYGYRSSYFRFPTGAYSHNALELVSSVGFKSVFWSVAYSDWDTAKQPDPDDAFNTVTSRYHKGAVILLHAVSQTNADNLARLIDNAHQRGYTFKTLDDYPWQ